MIVKKPNNPTQSLFEEDPAEKNPTIQTLSQTLFEEQLQQLLTLITHLSLSLLSQ